MTPRRREILHRYLATGNAKGCGVSASRVRLIVRDALEEYGCPPGGLVLDPFMGSGSTLIAARDSGRRAIGIDIREDQCEIAARRCQWLMSA